MQSIIYTYIRYGVDKYRSRRWSSTGFSYWINPVECDDLLNIILGYYIQGFSSAMLLEFMDDVALIAMGLTTQLLEESANTALKAVAM